MNIYNAIMKAADDIDKDSAKFAWAPVKVPECGSPACALGWIGFHAGLKSGVCIAEVLPLMDLPPSHRNGDGIFYGRMKELAIDEGLGGHRWRGDSGRVAKYLRLYAAKYHAPAKPVHTGLPDIVRDIFTKQFTAADFA